ncbi:ABC transporter permease [Massilia sp. IC2-278]|uniref:ABC transporter permease n=1 Tax=Massilia sp. IC2-278 TaxID=2887200 RepID=UPI001E2E96A4|nr:ABC transporter permease [Massilia sp. IC2-278]MCC2963143.1 ABC transporter permease [Massilia sp. IC2-278]
MFAYYFKLGLRNLRRNPALTALMVLILAVGVAASVSTLAILHVMSGDPIPGKSERLFVPFVDNGQPEEGATYEEPEDMQLSYQDAMNLLRKHPAERATAMFGTGMPVEPPRKDIPAFQAYGLAPTRDFFAMFEVPFLHGQPWSAQDEARGANVVVLNRTVAEKLYGDANPVGQRLMMKGEPFTVVGVLGDWNPMPRYYKLIGSGPATGEEFMIPLATAVRKELTPYGSVNCSQTRDPGYASLLASECTWVQAWFETRSGADRAELQSFLDNYASEQRKLGRLKRNAPNRLFDVMEWMEERKVVGNDTRLSAWLAFGFLVLCLVNTVGLLLAKFSARAPEVGIRRALGASRREIFQQFLIETGVIGLAGGLLGLLLAFGALALIGMQSRSMAAMARMDWEMLGLTFVISICAALVAGLLPTWRACQVTPAMQLKSQ